jgi:hypothetical protein
MSKKETMINQAHSDYGQMMKSLTEAMECIDKAKSLINTMNPNSAGTIVIELKNMYHELGNMNSALAKDYIDELESIRKKVD